MTDTATPPAAPAAPVQSAAPAVPAAPAQASQSPRSPVPPLGSPEAHMAAARKVFSPDPARQAPPAEPAKPADAAPAKPADAAPEKPAEPAPVEFPEDRLAEPKSDEAKAGWKELKAAVKAERNRALTLENQIKELSAKSATVTPTEAQTAEIERLRTDLKTAMDKLLVVSLKDHPDYHRQFVEPVTKAMVENEQLLADNGVTEKIDLAGLVSKPRAEFAKQVSELAGKMNSFDAYTFTKNMREAYNLKGEEAKALAQAGEFNQGLQQRTAQIQQQAFESVASEILPNMKPVEITDAMNEDQRKLATAYNQSVASMKETAKTLAFGKLSEKDVAQLSFKAATLDHTVKHVVPILEERSRAQHKMIEELTAELKSLRGGKTPAPTGGDDTGAAAPANKSIDQMAKELYAKR